MGTIASAVDHSKPSQCCPRNKSPYSLPSWPALLLLLAPRPESSCRGPILLCSRFWIQRRLEACKIQLLFSPSLGKRARSIAAGVYCSKSHEGVELLGVGIALR